MFYVVFSTKTGGLRLFLFGKELIIIKRWLYPIVSLLLLIVLWEVIGRLLQIPLYILPVPSQVLLSLYQERAVLAIHAWVTLKEAVIGLAVATLLAFIVSLLMDRFNGLRLTVYPHLVISQTIPVMVLGPIFSIWFGFGLTPKILMVVLMCFFPMVISFTDALFQVNQKRIILMKTYNASTWQIYRLVKIPIAVPGLLSGMRVAATYCVGGAIIGEWLSASAGLGYYMIRAKNGYLMDKVFATIVVVILLSLLLNLLVFVLENLLTKKRMIANG